MNKEMIRRWNEKIKVDDTCIFLGDFSFKGNGTRGEGEPIKAQEYIKQLNGKIIFVGGNHDTNNGVKTWIKSMVLEAGGIEIFCCHDPAESNNFYPLNLVGHVHDLWKIHQDKKFDRKSILINVGVDVNDFYPISLQEVLELYYNFCREKGISFKKNLLQKDLKNDLINNIVIKNGKSI